jgi:3-deoxy-D-manno-octulosonic-acid transferase
MQRKKIKQFCILFLIGVYNFILECIRVCILPFLAGVGKRRKWNLAERKKTPYAIRDCRNRTVVWIHAASLGEAKVVIRFMEILEQRHPEDIYVLTALTRTGVDYLQSHKTQSVGAIGFFPLDTLSLMEKMITRFGISRVWLMETELWPCMLWTCFRREVPVGIVNARMEERSFGWYYRFRWVLRHIFQTFDTVLAQDETYAERFKTLGVRPSALHIIGNLKSHITVKRPVKEQWDELRERMELNEKSFVITAGCVHAGEGEYIRKACEQIAAMGHSLRWIIVPRHLEDTPSLLQELGPGTLHLTDTEAPREWEVCLIEKIGILDDMYKIADAAFVGGTFVDVGGHNVWEPARYGIPVFFGPYYHTQNESCERLMTAGVGFKVDDAGSLAEIVVRVIKYEARKFIDAQQLFMETINKRQAVLEHLIP